LFKNYSITVKYVNLVKNNVFRFIFLPCPHVFINYKDKEAVYKHKVYIGILIKISGFFDKKIEIG